MTVVSAETQKYFNWNWRENKISLLPEVYIFGSGQLNVVGMGGSPAIGAFSKPETFISYNVLSQSLFLLI